MPIALAIPRAAAQGVQVVVDHQYDGPSDVDTMLDHAFDKAGLNDVSPSPSPGSSPSPSPFAEPDLIAVVQQVAVDGHETRIASVGTFYAEALVIMLTVGSVLFAVLKRR